MKKNFVLMVFLLTSLLCYSQAEFLEGFVVKQTGDTIYGFISYRGGVRDHNSCIFKQTNKAEGVTFSPEDISGFGFPDDRIFASKRIEIPDSSSEYRFVEVLVRGAVSLYSYNTRFFIQKEDDQLYELAITKKEILKEGRRFYIVTKKYLEILTLLLSDCEEVRERIPNVVLSERSLTGLVVLYNNCTGSPYEVIFDRIPAVKAAVAVFYGQIKSEMTVVRRAAHDPYTTIDVPYEKSESSQSGVYFDFVLPRFSRKLSLLAGITYYNTSFYSYTKKETTTTIEKNYVTIATEQISIPIGIKYVYSVNKISPYVNLGFFNSVNLNTINDWSKDITTKYGIPATTHYEGPALVEIKNQHGFWYGGGLVVPITKRLAGFLDLRIEHCYGLSKAPDIFNVKNAGYSIGLRLR